MKNVEFSIVLDFSDKTHKFNPNSLKPVFEHLNAKGNG